MPLILIFFAAQKWTSGRGAERQMKDERNGSQMTTPGYFHAIWPKSITRKSLNNHLFPNNEGKLRMSGAAANH